MASYHILHLIGVDVKSGHQNHFLLSVNDFDKPVSIDHRYIAGFEPFPNENLLRLIGTVPIPFHYLRTLHAKLAFLTQRKIIPLLINYLYLRIGYRKPYAANPLRAVNRIT